MRAHIPHPQLVPVPGSPLITGPGFWMWVAARQVPPSAVLAELVVRSSQARASSALGWIGENTRDGTARPGQEKPWKFCAKFFLP